MDMHVKAGFGKRFIAFFFDFTLFAILFYVCFTFMAEPVANNLSSIQAIRQEYLELGIAYGVADPTTTFFNQIVSSDSEAFLLFESDPRVVQLENIISTVTLVEYCVSGVIPTFLLYIVVPLIFKDGQTPGKKFVSLEISRTDDTELHWPALVLRALSLYLVEFCLSIFLFGIPVILSVMIAVFSERRQALHDVIARTYVVEGQGALIFRNAQEKDEYLEKIRKGR